MKRQPAPAKAKLTIFHRLGGFRKITVFHHRNRQFSFPKRPCYPNARRSCRMTTTAASVYRPWFRCWSVKMSTTNATTAVAIALPIAGRIAQMRKLSVKAAQDFVHGRRTTDKAAQVRWLNRKSRRALRRRLFLATAGSGLTSGSAALPGNVELS